MLALARRPQLRLTAATRGPGCRFAWQQAYTKPAVPYHQACGACVHLPVHGNGHAAG